MPEESRRTFLIRYAALALAAMAPSGARAAGDDGDAIKTLADDLMPEKKAVYGPPPSPYPTLQPRPPPPVAIYGPPPSPYPTDDPQRPLPAPVYGPPPRNPIDD